MVKKDRVVTPEERRLWREATEQKPASQEKTLEASPPLHGNGKKEKPPLAVAEGRQGARLLKPQGPVEAVLDLHGLSKIDAYERVRDFVAAAQAQGLRHVLVITGKGRAGQGILRAELPHWLNEPGLRARIGGIAQASPEKGGSGVFHVLLKRR